MTRRECTHGRNCGIDLCPLEDVACIGIECDQYQGSGWRRPIRTREQHLDTLRKTEQKLRAMRPQFGQRETFERRAMGYQGMIARCRKALGMDDE